MVARLVLGILAVTFLPLGLVFLLVGLLVDEPDSGSPIAFVVVGGALAAVGAVLAAGFVVLWRREAARRRRRQQGLLARATVVSADLNWSVRVNGRPALELTVDLPGAGRVSGQFVSRDARELSPGSEIDVLYDPAEPSNFEPVRS
jgi:hypothetical protein